MTDARKERAAEILKAMRGSDTYDMALCEELCDLADMKETWRNTRGEGFESILYAAASTLGFNLLDEIIDR